MFLLNLFPSAGSDNLSLRGVAKGCFLRFSADVLVALSCLMVDPMRKANRSLIEGPGSWFSAMRVCSFLWLAYFCWGMVLIRDAGELYCLSCWRIGGPGLLGLGFCLLIGCRSHFFMGLVSDSGMRNDLAWACWLDCF
ncbi:hypothetical protein M0R45_007026 [Rubus argutus]|uniref:Uncharacterized protein n=1 Tax=Rubus argutus TaxID=59490 RepID=A0AAW1YSG9_RUBAR